MQRLKGTFVLELGLAALIIAAGALFFMRGGDEPTSAAARVGEEDRTFDSNDPVERGCDLDRSLLTRIWRGFDDAHSEDVTTVPLEPNYSGTFGITSHSGPWDYLQTVPLVLYGPESIPARGRVDTPASIIDVYPTVASLTGTNIAQRGGINLLEGTAPKPKPPKLILTIMWDGAGRNMLERWPDAWPTLARMEEEGTSYVNAVVGSSPSITPATHSSLGTGTYPREHGVTAIEFRAPSGTVRSSFAGRNPADLELSTFGDEIDAALGNKPKVGMLAWKLWHIGMLGHGTALEGGDADQMALIGSKGTVTGNTKFYSDPKLTTDPDLLEKRLQQADISDGESDGKWLGHDVHALHDNPGWVNYEADLLIRMMKENGYGADGVPDLLFTNFKMTDIVGHQYTMDSPEEEGVLKAQDAALERLLGWLDKNISDYVVILSADHGHTPNAEGTGAWPILQGQVEEDINAHFDVPDGESLVEVTSAVGPFLNDDEMQKLGVTGDDVAEFLNSYTIAENWNEDELPKDYRDRGDENIFAASWSAEQFEDVLHCAFGSVTPPEDSQ